MERFALSSLFSSGDRQTVRGRNAFRRGFTASYHQPSTTYVMFCGHTSQGGSPRRVPSEVEQESATECDLALKAIWPDSNDDENVSLDRRCPIESRFGESIACPMLVGAHPWASRNACCCTDDNRLRGRQNSGLRREQVDFPT